MLLSELHYPLDPSLIAQQPIGPRDHARLFYYDRNNKTTKHQHFFDLPDLLDPETIVVLNETKVMRVRIAGKTTLSDGHTRNVELILLRQIDLNHWECAVFPGERLRTGRTIFFDQTGGDGLTATIESETYAGRIIRFDQSTPKFYETIDQIGSIPLPSYIESDFDDLMRYNTVFAKNVGSAAAPTAGLHFTPELFEKLKQKKITIEKITLHVGLGTFKPIRTEHVEDHMIHTEQYSIDSATALRLNDAKKAGKKILAVGTTTVRTLESAFDRTEGIRSGERETNIFITPGYTFRFVDQIITNFHLPGSTLLAMMGAFIGLEKLKEIYAQAQSEHYRFFSLGDGMLIK